ncbi:MAG TPA: helix-turn-helix transcriptional regulator [Solirubrobacteraceae bacterium]|nr:helix-turn-helix transcriptional regulator [Solirubrobacteraceae bacterium]
MSGVTASLADETVPQAHGSTADIAAAAIEALAVAALRVGFGLMTIAAASDSVFALLDGDGLLAGIEGAVLTGLAVGGLLRPATAALLLRPPGRVVILAGLFALAGAFDWGVQSHFSEVAPAIVWIAVIVSSPPWIVACVLVSAAGYLIDLLLKGHSLAWTLTPTGRGLVINQWVDLVANAGAVLVLVMLLRRFTASVPSSLAAARAGGPATTPALAAAVRTEPVALLPPADAASLITPLTDAEHKVLALLGDGLVPKQAALELSVTLATIRSHIAAAKRKTGARTVEQLIGIYAPNGPWIDLSLCQARP